jgi:hypothetical protein
MYVQAQEREGEAVDLGAVFQKGILNCASNHCTVLTLIVLYCIVLYCIYYNLKFAWCWVGSLYRNVRNPPPQPCHFTYCVWENAGVHKVSKNIGTVLKYWTLEGWQEVRSIPRPINILGSTERNLVATTTLGPEFVHPVCGPPFRLVGKRQHWALFSNKRFSHEAE